MSGRLTSGATATGADFLLELRCEEIPARMQAAARAELDKLFRAQMAAAGVDVGACSVWSTPRRLALIARDLPLATAAVSEEVKGPRTSAPPQALEGFLRKTGLTQDQLVDRDGVWFAVIDRPGRATADVLAEAIPAIIRAFAWPKSMRWGRDSASSESLRWVRPLSGIVALFGDELVACEVGGIAAGRTTRGHRFHSSGDIAVTSAADYAAVLRAAHVIVDQDERAAIIRDGAAKAAADAGLSLIADEGLVVENAGLTEWPVPLLGRFDEAFLEVPPEVIQLTARVNQKYFVVQDAAGKLANAFVCTANIAASDGGAEIVAGNRKVLAARLSDARFFWEQDQKKTLAQHAEKLHTVTYFENLGNYWEKQWRLFQLATSISNMLDSQHTDIYPRIYNVSELCKIDLVTDTVGEFPELQGVAASYLLPVLQDETYKFPAGAEDLRYLYDNAAQINVSAVHPAAHVLQLVDRLDSVVSLAAAGAWFTGSKDPFAIRQSALAFVAALLKLELRVSLRDLFTHAYQLLVTSLGYHREIYSVEKFVNKHEEERIEEVLVATPMQDTPDPQYYTFDSIVVRPSDSATVDKFAFYTNPRQMMNCYGSDFEFKLLGFPTIYEKLRSLIIDRLKVQQREAGVRHDLIDAVFALGGEDDLVRLLARVKALQAFMATDDGANLLAGYKRAANILKQSSPERGGGAREARDGGGARPDASLEAAAPLHHPSGGSLPRAGEDLALQSALDAAEPAAAAAVAEERFTDAMAALASLRAPIDAFFDGVMVNDPDPEIRAFRLGLLARFTGAVHGVADFSKIEG